MRFLLIAFAVGMLGGQTPAPLISGGAPQSGYSLIVSDYADFAIGTNGADVTTGNLNSYGTDCTWSITPSSGDSLQTISNSVVVASPGAFTVNGTWLPGNNSKFAYAFTPSG